MAIKLVENGAGFARRNYSEKPDLVLAVASVHTAQANMHTWMGTREFASQQHSHREHWER